MRLIVLVALASPALAAIVPSHSADAAQAPFGTETKPVDSPPEKPAALGWQCLLRGVVRAPDLSPNSVFPGEARLTAYGEGCNEIKGWAVGLKFRERAIVKVQAKDVKLPIRPEKVTKPKQNATIGQNWDDILSDVGSWHSYYGNDPDYERQLEAYETALRNESLWVINGSERIAFDTSVELPLSGSDWLSEHWLDVAQPFAAHVPNTNFPPIAKRMGYSVSTEMWATESSLDYYLLVNLRNGTTVHVPATFGAFLPQADPTAGTNVWPTDVPLLPDNGTTAADSRKGPLCEEGRQTMLNISLRPVQEPVAAGDTVTFEVKVTRTGNGTLYPASIHLQLQDDSYSPWLNQYANEDQRQRLLTQFSNAGSMVIAPNKADLERVRSIWRGNGEGWTGVYSATFDRPVAGGPLPDVFTVQVEMPLRRDSMPSFRQSFVTTRRLLPVRVEVDSHCLHAPQPIVDHVPSRRSVWLESEAKVVARDAEWAEYALPLPQEPTTSRVKSYAKALPNNMCHLPFHIVAESASRAVSGSPAIHYLDPGAQGIVLALPDTPAESITYPPIGDVHPETRQQALQRQRYGYKDAMHRPETLTRDSQYKLWQKYKGKHAAKLWNRKEAIARGEEVGDHDKERDMWFD